MPKVDLDNIEVEPWPARAVGGQQVGATTGIKVHHVPSGLTAFVNCERSQHRNLQIAKDMILGGLTSQHFRGGV